MKTSFCSCSRNSRIRLNLALRRPYPSLSWRTSFTFLKCCQTPSNCLGNFRRLRAVLSLTTFLRKWRSNRVGDWSSRRTIFTYTPTWGKRAGSLSWTNTKMSSSSRKSKSRRFLIITTSPSASWPSKSSKNGFAPLQRKKSSSILKT